MREYHTHGPPATLDFLPCEVENVHMDPQERSATRFFTALSIAEQEPGVRLAIESLRTFGGPLRSSPVWVFTGKEPGNTSLGKLDRVQVIPLESGPATPHYWFATKVLACARAEETAADDTRSLVWLSPGCLIVQPPELFVLDSAHDAAFRPVHIKNVGSLASEPLDEYWSAVYAAVGIKESTTTVESQVDSQQLRPYYNTHCFSIDPAKGLMRAWWDVFKGLVEDQAFQSGPCADELHRVFLHQAVLSALITKSLGPERIRILPQAYGYPLHFHGKIPQPQRVRVMNELVCPAYEEPADLGALPSEEPLKSWLTNHAAGPNRSG